MSKGPLKMQSWQIFHFARKHLGSSVLYAIFGKKNARSIDYWAQDPRYTNKPEGSYDPILGIKTLLETLDDHGHEAVVRAAISHIASGASSTGFNDVTELKDLLPTMSEEILGDYRAVGVMQAAIEAGLDVAEVDRLKTEAIDELHRTVALYRQEKDSDDD